MRVLAFRIWDKTHKKFIDPKDYSINGSRHSGQTGELLLDFDGKIRVAHFPCGNGDNSADSVFTPVDNQDNYVIQQFTGRKDSDGVEIYEGDIVKESWRENNPYGFSPEEWYTKSNTFTVKWENHGFHFPNEKLGNQQRVIEEYKLEVIGNVND